MDATAASTTERGAGDRTVPPGWRVNPSARGPAPAGGRGGPAGARATPSASAAAGAACSTAAA